MRRELGQKRYMIYALVFSCVLCSGSFLFKDKGPKIVFKEDSWHFGTVEQGKILNHVFVFRNEGEKTLKIKRVRKTCGCTAVLVSERDIAPGKKGEIRVTLNTRGYEGKLSKYIYVESNDPAQPSKHLTVSANIDVPPRPRLYLDKYSLDLGLFLAKEEIRARTKIKNRGERELRVNCSHREASFFSGGKRISFPLRIPSGKEVEVEIRIPPRKRTGMLREYIKINSNDPDPLRQRPSLFLYGYIISEKQLKELLTKYKNLLN